MDLFLIVKNQLESAYSVEVKIRLLMILKCFLENMEQNHDDGEKLVRKVLEHTEELGLKQAIGNLSYLSNEKEMSDIIGDILSWYERY